MVVKKIKKIQKKLQKVTKSGCKLPKSVLLWSCKTKKGGRFMLFGEYDHQVDAKNRIRIPVKLKSELGSNYVFMKGAAKCISVYPASKVDELVSSLSGISTFDAEAQKSFAEFMASFYPGDEDGQGRVVIPEKLREYAGIDKEVVTIGMVNHVDIYSKEERERIKNEMSYQDRISLLKDRTK